MSLSFSTRIDAERLQLAAYKVIYSNINAYIVEEQAHGQDLDAEFEALTGRSLTAVTLEQYEPRNVHYGHRPSMIELPIERLPAIAVMAWSSAPNQRGMDIDYGYSIQLMLAIETIVKAGPFDMDGHEDEIAEELVGRRIKRHAEAINRLMNDHRSLDGSFLPPETAPRVVWGDIFIRDDDPRLPNERYHWQGVRMEYTFSKQSNFGIDQ